MGVMLFKKFENKTSSKITRYTLSIITINNAMKFNQIKTHDSKSRGQEKVDRTQQMNELFTHGTAMKFTNALNKPPLKLSFSYQGLSMF